MKTSSVVLFSFRLFFYFSVIALIFVHPGISVSFDRIGIMQWFVIIPLMAIIAFLPLFALNIRRKFLFTLILLFLLSVIAGGFSPNAIIPFIAGIISFILTFLLFNNFNIQVYSGLPAHGKLAGLAALEPFFFAWVCLRLLSLSRSGEDIAGQSVAITQFILVWTAVVFLLHSAVIYFCLYKKSYLKAWKEGLVLFFGSLALLIIVLVVLPPDFVCNMIIENSVMEKIPEQIPQSDSDRGMPQRGNGRRTLPGNGNGQGELRGISEHDWPGRGTNREDNRQYMVMIVASDREPVYMGNNFRGQLDPVRGFILNPEESLNDLARQRLFVTWSNNEPNYDMGRERQEVFSLSTLQQKYLPYVPVTVDPVILHENAGPLRYIHQVVSDTHYGDPLQLVSAPERLLSEFENFRLAPYLEINLNDTDRNEFELYLDNALELWQHNRRQFIESDRYMKSIFENLEETSGNMYMEIIIAILTSFSVFQYNIVYNNDHSIDVLKDFLFNSKEGDCVAFSNTLALLGRLAGIPSRVVTGYLASESLQTPAHLRGLSVMRNRIPILQQFPFENLFLVTNLHGHSWTQFYIPDYGWIDFEATSFAIPPVGSGDFNNWDVIIPIIYDDRTISQIRRFPWQAAGRAVVTLVIIALICAYALRYSRELILYHGVRTGGRAGSRSLYLLLLARLAADGQPIKPASKTANEYSELFKNFTEKANLQTANEPEPSVNTQIYFKNFAEIYSELRWRKYSDPNEMNRRFRQLIQEYYNILNSTRRRGIHRFFIRIFSLRGLTYL